MAASATLIEPDPRNTAPAVLCAALWLREQDLRGTHARGAVRSRDAGCGGLSPRRRRGTFPLRGRDRSSPSASRPAGRRRAMAILNSPRARSRVHGLPAAPLALHRKARQPQWRRRCWQRETICGMPGYSCCLRQDHDCSLRAPRAAHDRPCHGGPAAGIRSTCSSSGSAAEPWAELPNISIDYAIMEKAVEPGGDALWRQLVRPRKLGCRLAGERTRCRWQRPLRARHSPSIAASRCCARKLTASNSSASGLTDIMAVAMPDAVLVARKGDTQRVREAVETLKARKVKQATAFNRDHRPWGWFESLAMGPRFQVKRIVVKPGAALSLQSHRHRAEHWVVVAGHRAGDGGRRGPAACRKRIDLHQAGRHPPAGEPRRDRR